MKKLQLISMFLIFMILIGFSISKDDYRKVMSDPQSEYGNLYSVYGLIFQVYLQVVEEENCYFYLVSFNDLIFGMFGVIGSIPYLFKDDYFVAKFMYFYDIYTYETVSNGVKTIPLFLYSSKVSTIAVQ